MYGKQVQSRKVLYIVAAGATFTLGSSLTSIDLASSTFSTSSPFWKGNNASYRTLKSFRQQHKGIDDYRNNFTVNLYSLFSRNRFSLCEELRRKNTVALQSPTFSSFPVNQKQFIRTFKTQKCKVFVKDMKLLEKKILKFKKDGPTKLQVISDFDFTMTHFFLQKSTERSPSCHKVLEDCGLLSDEYHQKAQGLQKKYYPLEIDPKIPLPEKIKYMEEWVTTAHEEMIRSGMPKSVISKAVKQSPLKLRTGVADLIVLSELIGFPILIFSAGIANIIEEVMKKQASLPDTVHIVSNTMIFGGREHNYNLIDFEEPVFHVFNKRVASVLNKYDYFKQNDYHKRRNILLIGDSLGDLHMSDGLQEHYSSNTEEQIEQKGKIRSKKTNCYNLEEHIIRVGFLNDRVEDRYQEYSEKFDIVLIGDGDFEYILSLLTDILDFNEERDEL